MDFAFDECRLAVYGDSELVGHILSSPRICQYSALYVISPNLVVKCVSKRRAADEVEGIRFAQRLRLRVPSVKRIIHKDGDVYVIMTRVHGRTIEAAWPEMSWWSTIRAAFQLRNYIRVMRSKSSPTAGSLVTGECNSIWLEDYYGLPDHATPEMFSSYIQFWLEYQPRRKQTNKRRNTRKLHILPPTPKHFVFTHQDLAPRNLLLDEQDNLWIVDWGRCGWYPLYFEYAGIQDPNFRLISWGDRLRWWIFCLISVGFYRKERRALAMVRGKCMRYPLARKDVVLPEEAHIDVYHLRKRGV